MKKFLLKATTIFLVFLLTLGWKVSWGQTTNGFLDFGNTTNGTTATTTNTGFGGLRVSSNGGGFTIQNPGQSIGTQGELRGIAPTSTSINSVGVTSAEYGTAAQTFTISFELHLSGGSSGTWYFFAGNGTSFGSAQSSGFTGSETFTGIRWVFGASSTITTSNRAAGAWATISGTPFAQSTAYHVTIVGNNSASTVSYGAASAYSVAANTYDLWVNGTLVGDNLGKAQLANVTAINAFRFYGESSTGNVATIALDNIRWYNSCVLPPTHLALVNVPTTGTESQNLTSFTAEARSGSATGPVANSFTGAITVAKVSGSGSISGTTAPNAVAGVATYSNIQFSAPDTYTINATATAPIVNAATSGNIVIASGTSNTIAQLNTGIASSPLTGGATNQAVFGFSASSTGTPNLTAFNIGTSSTTVGKFTNIKLFRSTDNSFSTTGDNTEITGITINQTASQLQFSGLSEALSSTARNYFVVADIDASVTGSTTAVQPSLTNANVTTSAGTVTGGDLTGTNFSFNSAGASSPPTLTAAPSATVDGAFNITFTNDGTWAGAITGITVDGVSLTGGYTVGTNIITFTPSASNPTTALQIAGSKSIVITATGYTNATVTQSIGLGSINKLQLLMPGETAAPGTTTGKSGTATAQTAGTAFNITVNSVDQYWNIVSSTRTVAISSSDANATMPANTALTAGSATISVTLTTAGVSRTVTATDQSGSSITASTGAAITVNVGAFSKMQLLLPGETAAPGTASGKTGTPNQQTAGTGFTVTVNAVDANWNVVTAAPTNTIAITTSDANDTHPGNAALASGTRTFTVTFTTAGSWTVTATNSSDGTKTANTSPSVTVVAGAASKLQVLMPGETAAPGTASGKTGTPTAQTAGSAVTVTVNSVDANWNLVSSTRTIAITSSDANATLPSNAALVAGTQTYSVTFKTAGGRTVTATDQSGPAISANTGTSTTINAGALNKLQILLPGETAAPGTATGKTGTPTGQGKGTAFAVTVNGVDANWNTVTSATDNIAITSSDASATLPGNAVLVSGTKSFNVTLNTIGTFTVTATDVTNGAITASTSANVGVTLSYTTPANSDCSANDNITNVTFGTLNNNSTCAATTGYNDFTALSAPSITAGTATNISVTVPAGGTENVAVWIDYNQNGTFETTEYTSIGSGNGVAINSSITVPLTALSGNTRMRVRVQYSTAIANTDANTTFTYGETEDYTVNIVFPTGYYWNGASNSASPAAGGTGTWLTTNNWRQPSPSGSQATWADANAAYFAGTGGTVTLSGNVAPTSTTFGVSGYTLATSGVSGITLSNGVDIGSNGLTISPISGADLTLPGIVSGSGALTKSGAGTLFLTNGSNSYSGGTTINAGTISIDGVNRLGATTGTLTINGGTLQVTSSVGSTRNIVIGNSASIIDIASSVSYTANSASLFSGSGKLNKTGAGTLIFPSTNATSHTYSGGLSITGGAVQINKERDLGAVPGSVTANNIVLDGGTLAVGTSVSTSANRGIGITANGGTFNIATSTTLTIGGIIANNTTAGILNKTGSGILLLNAANTYTGGTNISAGTVRLGIANALPNTGTITLDGGTLSTGATTGFNETVGTLNLNSNSTIALGTGAHTLTFAASNGVTWNGTTLTITGWTGTRNTSGTAGKIFFGSNSSGLTAGQLSKISFTGFSGTPILLSTGELVPPAVVATAPTITSITPGNGQLSVAFSAPSDNGGASVTNYKYSTDGGSTFTAYSPAQTTSPIIITGLTNGTSYNVQILAVNSAGDGAASSTTASTPRTTATAPSINSITPGNGQLTVSITAPTDNGGAAISNYKYSTNGGSTFTAVSPASTSTSIVISGLTNGTSYNVQVLAVNAAGDGTASATTAATPYTVPSAPTINSINPGDQQLSVDFTAPTSNGGNTISNYQYSTDGGASYNAFAPAQNSSPLVITGLTNGVSYNVLIKAVNNAGAGSASNQVSGTPLASATVPDAPTITGITPGNAQLSVVFTPPASNGGATITNYKYSIDGGSSFVSAGSTTSPIVITGLTNGTTYNVQLLAVNSVGDGTASSTSTGTPRTTANAPTITGITPSNTQLTVTISVPTNNGGAAITNYKYSIDGGSTFNAVSPASTSTTIVITGLTNGTSYNVKVLAVNAAGDGAASNTVAATPATTPGVPTGVSVTAGNAQLTVNFTTPVSTGGSSITNYEYSVNGGTSFTAVSPASTATTIVISGLTNGTTYSVQIRAVNAMGSGTATSSTSGTPITIATAPTITGITGGNAQLSVAFTAPTDNGGSTITNYQYSTDGGVSFRNRASGTTASPLVISTLSSDGATALVNNTAYNVQIRAINGAGNGVASSTTVGTPVPQAPGAPTSVTATANGTSGQVSVGFTAPASDGGATITSYTVTSNPGSITATGTTSPIVVTGLTNGTPYTFTVTATNSVGTGSASSASNSATPTSKVYQEDFSNLTTTSATFNSSSPLLANANLNTFKWVSSQANAGLTGSSGNCISMNNSSGTPTITLTFNIAAGSQLDITGFDFWRQRSNAGAQNWTLTIASTNVTSAQVGSGSVPTSGSAIGTTNVSTSRNGLTGTVTITFSFSGASGGGTLRLDDFILYGTVSSSPTVTSPTVTSITNNSAVLGANVTDLGNGAISARGTVYGTSASPTGNALAEGGTTTGTFTHTRSGLTPNTLYYYRGYATNTIGTAYTTDGTFTTLHNAPTSSAASSVLPDGFTANWAAPTGGGAATYTYTLQYATTSDFSSGSTSVTGISSAATSSSITGLAAGTQYWYRVAAVNAQGASAWSATQTLTTVANTAPILSTPTVSAISTTGATLGATVVSTGGVSISARGTVYGTSANPTSNALADGSTALGAYTQVRTGLTPNTVYYYRGYATNSVGTDYSADGTFTTLQNAPTSAAASSITGTGFTANWTAPVGGGSATYTYTLQYSTSATFASGNTSVTGITSGTMSQAITGLSLGTTYYYRVLANNAGGDGAWSATTQTVTTLNVPTLTTPTSASITTTSATLGATITATGNAAITARGTVYGTTASPTGNALAEGGTATSDFTHSRTGLTPNTLYYYRGYATNSVGTGYSADGTFTTVHNAPTSAAATNVSGTSATANWTAPAGGGSAAFTYTVQYSTTSDFSSGNASLTNISSATTSTNIPGLNSLTQYWYRVQVANAGGNSAWSATQTFTTGASPVSLYSTNFTVTSTTFPTGWTTSGANNLTNPSNSSASSGYATPISASGSYNLTDGGTTLNSDAIITLAGQVNTVNYNGIRVLYGARASSSSYTGTIAFEWSSDGSNWNPITYTDVSRDGSWYIINGGNWITLPSGAENQANLRFRFRFNRTTTSGNYKIDDFTVQGSPVPVISTSGTLSALSTTYTSASSTTSFSVSGASMQTGITITPPTGFEVSTSPTFASGGGSGSPITISGTGAIASTTVYVRLAANASIGTYSGNIVLTSTNATTVNVPTILSTVNARPNYWIGGTGSWATNTNWEANTAPSAGADITIAAGTPSLAANTNVGAIAIASGAGINLNGNTLTIAGAVTGTGIITGGGNASLTINSGGNGTLYFNPSANSLKDFVINTSGNTVTLGSALNITGTLTPTAGTLDLGNYNITLKSTSITNTALVGVVGATISYSGTGRFVVERYIPKGNRAYRALAPAVNNAGSIFNNWQEGGASTSGYGTHITGAVGSSIGISISATGLDYTTSGNPSLYTYNIANDSWTAVTNTKTTNLDGRSGYYLLIRGDRSFNLFTTPQSNTMINATTLRSTGQLITGDVSYNTTYLNSTTANTNYGFSLVGNPYVAPLDWSKVVSGGGLSNLSTTCWIFDPVMATPGYVTYNGTLNIISGAGSSAATKFIQPGQAFFVKYTGSGTPSMLLKESYKDVTATKTTVFDAANPFSQIRMSIYKSVNGTPAKLDEAVVAFDNAFSNNITNDDSYKMANSGENLSIRSNNVDLAIEGKQPAQAGDTVSFKLAKMTNTVAYELRIDKSLFNGNGQDVYLGDKLAKTVTLLTAANSTFNFTVDNANTATYQDRFYLTFKNSVLPLNSIRLTAAQQNNQVQLTWNTVGEANLTAYEVEKSTNGTAYILIGTLAPKNTATASYQFTDAQPASGNNYYRIKVIGNNEGSKYSNVAAVKLGNYEARFTVYPNPFSGKKLQIQMTAVPAGKYLLTLTNAEGKQIMVKEIQHNGGAASAEWLMASPLAGGNYHLTIRSKDGQQVLYSTPLVAQP